MFVKKKKNHEIYNEHKYELNLYLCIIINFYIYKPASNLSSFKSLIMTYINKSILIEKEIKQKKTCKFIYHFFVSSSFTKFTLVKFACFIFYL